MRENGQLKWILKEVDSLGGVHRYREGIFLATGPSMIQCGTIHMLKISTAMKSTRVAFIFGGSQSKVKLTFLERWKMGICTLSVFWLFSFIFIFIFIGLARFLSYSRPHYIIWIDWICCLGCNPCRLYRGWCVWNCVNTAERFHIDLH